MSGQYASYWNAFLLPLANEVWGKVICLQVCACPQGGVWSQGVLGPGGVPARGTWSQWGRLVPVGGACSRGVPGGDPPRTATAEGGTHPTGMYSYYRDVYRTFCKSLFSTSTDMFNKFSLTPWSRGPQSSKGVERLHHSCNHLDPDGNLAVPV